MKRGRRIFGHWALLPPLFPRLSPGSGFPSECASDHPLESHQWLPGQWTPVLYGLSRDWRHYARSVLTHTLTVDLAIAVSLQRPDGLDSFLSNFPSLQVSWA